MRKIWMVLTCAAALFAQEEKTAVVTLKYVLPDSLMQALNTVAAGKARFSTSNATRTVTISGPQAVVEGMEATLKKLDLPPPKQNNVEVIFYMIVAAPQGENGPLPAELSGVAQQLRNVFGLKSVRLLESAVVRARESRPVETSGIMAPMEKVQMNALYEIAVKAVAVTDSEKGRTIRLDGLRFHAKLPASNGTHYSDAGINTDIDIHEGQKIVVGKSSIDTASQSIFLVVTAKVVD